MTISLSISDLCIFEQPLSVLSVFSPCPRESSYCLAPVPYALQSIVDVSFGLFS